MVKLGVKHERNISKVNLFNFDKILIPLHINENHWALCEIDLVKNTLGYFDSLGGDGTKIMETLLSYIENEHLLKKKKRLDTTDFKLENVKCLKQKGMNDCGIHVLVMADHLSTDSKFTFRQKDMPMYRYKIAYEIINNKVL